MMKKAVPMIHVPDVRAAVEWYTGLGFTVTDTYDDGSDGLSFAVLSFGSSSVMFNQGGRPSTQHRREVDLYVYTEAIDELYRRLKDRVDVVETPHDKFYGMREFIIRDLNRFWLTFGQLRQHLIFIYGSLRRGSARAMSVRFPKATFIADAKVSGSLYDLGAFPGLLLNASSSPVVGEVYEVDVETLSELDEFEASSDYWRQPVEISVGAERRTGWVYAPRPESCAHRPLIPSGDWIEYAKTKKE